MFDITEYGEKVIRVGGKKYAAKLNQEEIHKSGRWLVHLRNKTKSGFWNYCLYLDKSSAQKKVWYLTLKDGVFIKNHDFKDLRKNSPETLSWLFRTIKGDRYPAPHPDGFVNNNQIGRPKKCKASRPLTKEEKALAVKWSALPEFISYLRSPSWAKGIFGLSKMNFGIEPDDARDIFDVLRRNGYIHFSGNNTSKIKDVSDDQIYIGLYRQGELNKIRGVDWIDKLRLQFDL